jgi:hypothetical protein
VETSKTSVDWTRKKGGSHLLVDGRVTVANRPDVAFKMSNVHWVESDLASNGQDTSAARCRIHGKEEGFATYNCDPKSDISLGQLVAYKVFLGGQDLFQLVKRFEQSDDTLLVSRLSNREPSFVDSVFKDRTIIVRRKNRQANERTYCSRCHKPNR